MRRRRSQPPVLAVCVVALGLVATRAARATTFVSIDHLATPTIYDNAGGSLSHFGQSFTAVDDRFAGVRVYVDDPSRPGQPEVGPLDGPASLALYRADPGGTAVLLGLEEVVAPGQSLSGLVTFTLSAPIAITPGERYIFAIQVEPSEGFGIGLRSQTSSTYAEGAETVVDRSTLAYTEFSNGRDLSFQVLAATVQVPEPAHGMVLAGLLGLLAAGRRTGRGR